MVLQPITLIHLLAIGIQGGQTTAATTRARGHEEQKCGDADGANGQPSAAKQDQVHQLTLLHAWWAALITE